MRVRKKLNGRDFVDSAPAIRISLANYVIRLALPDAEP